MDKKLLRTLLYIALILMIVGGLVANLVQRDFGNVTVRDVRFAAFNGRKYSALLYIPKGVTTEHPAPGILAIHGYINSRETQDGFAIEFARRGYVVLALDQSGHGYSDPPAFADGFGGIAGLAYLQTLQIVDQKNICLEGHSMGGWAVVVAAGTFPNAYKCMVLEGSSTGTFGAPDGTATFPKNLMVVESTWDEFASLMWLTPKATDVGKTDKMKTLFNTTSDVVQGQLYGNLADGTARILWQPKNTHAEDHISTVAIGHAIDWMQQNLVGGVQIPYTNQIWYWKEIGTLFALLGFFMFIIASGGLLLTTPFFSTLVDPLPAAKGLTGWGWWIGVIITAALGPLTLFTFVTWEGTLLPSATWLAPQLITNQVVFWAVLDGLIALVLFLIWHFLLVKKADRGTGDEYGLTWGGKLNWPKIGKSFLLAAATVALGYATLQLTGFFYTTDYRFWIFAVKLPDRLQFYIMLRYVIPLFFYFFIASMVLFGQLRKAKFNMWQEMGVNFGIFFIGYLVFLLAEYIPMWTTGLLLNPDQPLWTIIAYQFVPVLGFAAFFSTFFYRKTGRIYTSAFLNALLWTLVIVAGTATHFAFGG